MKNLIKESLIVKNYLSKNRLYSYKILLMENNKHFNDELDLYKKNIDISKEFYGLLSYFEIFLRNSIDEKMKFYYGNNWLNNQNIPWRDAHKKQIDEAKKRVKNNYTNDDIISNLQLGFWIHLFDKNYQSLFWYKVGLNNIFPQKTHRDSISKYLTKIGKLRNRISHYEIIINNKIFLQECLNHITIIIEGINKDLSRWLIDNSNFNSILNEI